MTVGKRIQMARKACGLSQQELGKLLGVSGSMIGQYENDLRNPKFETLEKIAKALDADVWEFAMGDAVSDTVLESVEKILKRTDINEETLALWLMEEAEQREILQQREKIVKNKKVTNEEIVEDEVTEEEKIEYRANLLNRYFYNLNSFGQRKLLEFAQVLSRVKDLSKDYDPFLDDDFDPESIQVGPFFVE